VGKPWHTEAVTLKPVTTEKKVPMQLILAVTDSRKRVALLCILSFLALC